MVKITAPHPVHLEAFRGKLSFQNIIPLCDIKEDKNLFYYIIDISYERASEIISTNSLYKKNGIKIINLRIS